jgi:hypothetical protein
MLHRFDAGIEFTSLDLRCTKSDMRLRIARIHFDSALQPLAAAS